MKIFIKYKLILFAVLLSANLYSQWISQNSGTVNVLSCVSFTDANTGTAAGLTHTILRTTNGGTNWISQPNATGANLWGIQFINANTGMVIGESGTVFKTTNGGANWVNTFPPVENFWAVNVLNANIAFVCGSTGLIIKTTDGGTSWNTLNTGLTSPLLGINFTDLNTGYCSGSTGKIIKTTDGGATWNPQTSGTTENLFCIKLIDADTVYAGGENGKLLKTTNGGASWNLLTSGSVQRLVSISFSDAGTGSICGLANTILRTTNYGASWSTQFSGVSGEDFYGISFVDGTTGFCVGSTGTILKTTSGGFPFPSVPALLTPANGANGIPLTAFLDWDSSAVTKSYSLQLGTDSLFTSPIIDLSGLVLSQYNVPSGNLNNNIQYYWHVRGTNAAGNGNWSPASRFRTIVALPLAPVLVLPVNFASNVSITPSFDWDSTSPALYYRIQVSQDSLFATSEVDFTNIPVSNFDLVSPPLSHNARYYWHVQATNDAGSGPFSNTFNFTTSIAIPSAPSLVSPANGAVNISLIPVLDWRDDITVTSYQLQLSQDSTFASASIIDTSGSTTSQLTVPAGLLNPVSRYYWRVRTTNSLGTGPFSEVWHFNTLLTSPGTPVLAAPPNGAVDISTIVTVDWHDVPLTDSYKLQVSIDSTFASTVVNINVSASQYTIQGGILNNNTVYYWRVNATNTVGTGPFSEVWHFRTVISAPLAAPSLISPANGSTVGTLTPLTDWNDVFSTTGYKINIATDSLFISPVVDTNITNSQYSVPAGRLNGSTTYYWRVRGFNLGGYGPWSTVWNFITGPIGINMISTIIPKSYKLYNNYPNPFNPSTKIRFDLPNNSHTVIKIFDLLGRQVSEIINMQLAPGRYETSWNADNISSGIYFYRLETEQFTAVKKMLYVK